MILPVLTNTYLRSNVMKAKKAKAVKKVAKKAKKMAAKKMAKC